MSGLVLQWSVTFNGRVCLIFTIDHPFENRQSAPAVAILLRSFNRGGVDRVAGLFSFCVCVGGGAVACVWKSYMVIAVYVKIYMYMSSPAWSSLYIDKSNL